MTLRKASLAGSFLLLTACGQGGGGVSAQPGPSGDGSSSGAGPTLPLGGIQPMTQVNVTAATGYFQDPHPVYPLGDTTAAGLPVFSGTTKELLSCPGSIQPGCFSSTPVSVDYKAFMDEAAKVGSTITNLENLNIYQDSAGAWQMAVVAHLTNAKMADWNVILHAHPTSAGSGSPTAWTADALLVGDLGASAPDNYDPKYLEDNGILYLIYNKQLTKGQDGIVAQVMESAAKPSSSAPVPLLGPETDAGGYKSEIAYVDDQNNDIKITEAANVTKINGKYVLTYSVGTFDRPNYKVGIAYSDSFIPPPGGYYKRPQKLDTAGVWGTVGHAEAPYLLQSQIAGWPNYTASQVIAPGVGSIMIDATGTYYLAFAGYDPSDIPNNATTGRYQGSHRRPYFIRLQVQVPPSRSAAETSPQDLASWIEPVF